MTVSTSLSSGELRRRWKVSRSTVLNLADSVPIPYVRQGPRGDRRFAIDDIRRAERHPAVIAARHRAAAFRREVPHRRPATP